MMFKIFLVITIVFCFQCFTESAPKKSKGIDLELSLKQANIDYSKNFANQLHSEGRSDQMNNFIDLTTSDTDDDQMDKLSPHMRISQNYRNSDQFKSDKTTNLVAPGPSNSFHYRIDELSPHMSISQNYRNSDQLKSVQNFHAKSTSNAYNDRNVDKEKKSNDRKIKEIIRLSLDYFGIVWDMEEALPIPQLFDKIADSINKPARLVDPLLWIKSFLKTGSKIGCMFDAMTTEIRTQMLAFRNNYKFEFETRIGKQKSTGEAAYMAHREFDVIMPMLEKFFLFYCLYRNLEHQMLPFKRDLLADSIYAMYKAIEGQMIDIANEHNGFPHDKMAKMINASGYEKGCHF